MNQHYKLRFSTPKFNYSGKTTYCIYTCTIIHSGVRKDKVERFSPFIVIGKSTCSQEDSYSKLKGRIIADSKAKRKAYLKALQLFKNFVDIDNALSKIAFHSSLTYYADKEKEHLDEICR